MRRVLAVAAIALLLAACEARAEIEVTPSGSGTIGFSLLLSPQEIAAFGGIGGIDPLDQIREELDPRFRVEEIRDGSSRGIRATIAFANPGELHRIVTELNEEEESGPFGGGFEDFRLERRGDGWLFAANAPPPDAGGFGASPGDGSFDLGEGFEDLFTISFRVTLPGERDDSTADRTESSGGRTTFIWEPEVDSTAPVRLVAQTRGAGSGGFPVLPVAAAGGALALAALVGAIVVSKRRAAMPPAVEEPPVPAPE